MRRSPLGLLLPETVGRQHIPEMTEIAAEQGTTRARGGEHVEHLCPDCGLTPVVVTWCSTCGGRGRLTEVEMARRFG